MAVSYSQFGQDIHALLSVYKGKRDGYFIEVGAYDGIESSNTYLMEKDYNWKGICVECNPEKYNMLKKNRKSINLDCAVYDTNDELMEFFISGGFSGLVKTNNHQHIVNDQKIFVKTKKLTTILEEANAPHFIEYLSLDTEGSEYDILNSHDFNKYTFGYICVEHNNIEKNRLKIRALLENNGYRWCKENGDSRWGVIDDEYIHTSIDPLKNITIPFLNHSVKECGVYQYGLRLFNILKSCSDINYIYIELSSLEEYNTVISLIDTNNYSAIIYNYHTSTMPWLKKENIQNKLKNIGIPHESPDTLFDITLSINPFDTNGIPRPLFENIDSILKNPIYTDERIKEFIDFSKPGVPIFGSFGFAFINKGFDKIVKVINEQYDNAIIKLVMPTAAFNPNGKYDYDLISNMCKSNVIKPGIELIMMNTLLTDEELLLFLNSNTANMFLYDKMSHRGVSSVLDYVLSVKTPIVISDSHMFRSIYNDSICVYKNPIDSCIESSKNLHEIYSVLWSNKNVIGFFNKNIHAILKN